MSSHQRSVTCVHWGGSDLIYSSSQDSTIKVWRAADVCHLTPVNTDDAVLHEQSTHTHTHTHMHDWTETGDRLFTVVEHTASVIAFSAQLCVL